MRTLTPILAAALVPTPDAHAAENTAPAGATPPATSVAQFKTTVQPILRELSFDCHGDGLDKRGVSFDPFAASTGPNTATPSAT